MVERICAQCQRGNALENRFCAHCGASLEHTALPGSRTTSLATTGSTLPTQFKHVGQALALSLAALAAEAAVSWLRRRVEQMQHPPTTQTSVVQPIARSRPAAPPAPTGGNVTIFRQHEVQVWVGGELVRETIERTIWRRDG